MILPLFILLSGCEADCPLPEDVPVLDATPEQRAAWLGAANRFMGWTGVSGICVDRVSFTERNNINKESNGLYTRWTSNRRGTILVADDIISLDNTIHHELCHWLAFRHYAELGHDRSIPAPELDRGDLRPYELRHELFAEICDNGPYFANRLLRFSEACGFGEYEPLLDLIVNDVFLPYDDDRLSDRAFQPDFINAMNPPDWGDSPSAAAIQDGVVKLYWDDPDPSVRGPRAFVDPYTLEPQTPPDSGCCGPTPRDYATYGRRAPTTGAFGDERPDHPAIGRIAAMLLHPPGLHPALVPLAHQPDGYVPFEGVCAAAFSPQPGTVAPQEVAYDDPDLVSLFQPEYAWPHEPVLDVIGAYDGLWLFTGRTSGAFAWWHLPLEMPNKLPDLYAPYHEVDTAP